METTELDSEGSAIPATQSQTVRKNISLKLKGKGKGTHAYKGRTPRKKEVPAPVTAVVENIIENEIKPDIIDTSLLKATIDEEELFKLEPPTFITSNSGPPEPMHHGMKLRWDYKVNLMGTKVVNPLIHTCKKCSIPILLYGRMIPCKHVFCFDCANKSDKVCFRCSEKVSRVEQTSLGTLFTCVYGGSKRNGSDGCSRTYLSQRDLQAHINHRHLRQVAPSSTTTPTTTAVNPASKGSSIELQRPSMSNTTPHVHTSDYRSRPHGNKSQLQVAADANYRPHVIGSLMSQLNPYPSDVHHGYERSNAIVTAVTSMAHQMVPPPVLSPYPLTVVSQAGAQVGVHPSICVPIVTAAGTTAVQPYDSTPIPVVSVPSANVIVPPPTRTNLITVPIHDDTAAQTPPSDYLQNPYHQHGATQQQAYLPPMVGPPYTTPPPVSYPTTYCTPTIATTFPPPQAPHYPPPPLYSTQLPPPTVAHHQVPRYSTPPPRYGNPPTQTTQYEDHSRLGSSQYPPVPWGNQQRVNTAHQHPPPIGPPPQTRPPFY